MGKKDPRENIKAPTIVQQFDENIDAGSDYIIIEGKASGMDVGIFDEKGNIRWEIAVTYKDLLSYRITDKMDKTGAIVIWEHPIEDPPYGLYIAGCDPYDHDKSVTNSLGS